jgi:hypothetical protein
MTLKKYNQLFEADIKKTLPEDYIRDVRRRAAPHMGGPSRQEFMEAMQLMNRISQIQEGHEKELTEIGERIIKEYYSRMLEGVDLDIAIVDPFDEEKMQMATKMQKENEEEEEEEEKEEKEEPKYPEFEVPIKVPQEEVDRRKIINNIMQGEAQNVHSMMYSAKEDIDKINPRLLDLYMRHLEINRKMDWDENRPDLSQNMQEHPEMANCMETNYKGKEGGGEGEEGQEGEMKPTIKVRVLDLPMLIHETVKGIYELMSHKAIPEDSVMAGALLKLTDTLKDEEEDIKYGPFIAADIRDYINDLLKRTEPERNQTLPNVREFIFSKMMDLPAGKFVELIKNILMKETDKADAMLVGRDGLVKDAIKDAIGESDEKPTYQEDIPTEDDVESGNELIDFFNKPSKSEVEEKPEPKQKKWFEYSKGELNNFLNKAIDDQDWTKAREIQAAIERKDQNNK